MSANRGAIAIVVVGGALGAAWLFLSRGKVSAAVAPAGGQTSLGTPPPDPPQPPETAGPSAGQIAGLVASTGTTIAGIVAGAGAPTIAASGAIGAGGAAVGGGSVAGSVAAEQTAVATAGAATPAGASTTGVSAGMSGMAVGLTIGIGAAIVIGIIVWRARRNETKEDREDFAESLGFYDSAIVFGQERRQGNMDKLHAAMLSVDPVVGEQLWIEATQQIGKHDKARNVEWMHKVLRLFGIETENSGVSAAISAAYDRPFDDEEVAKDDEPIYEMLA